MRVLEITMGFSHRPNFSVKHIKLSVFKDCALGPVAMRVGSSWQNELGSKQRWQPHNSQVGCETIHSKVQNQQISNRFTKEQNIILYYAYYLKNIHICL